MSKPLSTEEVYFLVRVGSWDQQQLEAWVKERISYEEYFDDYEPKEYDEQWFDEDVEDEL